MYEMYKAMISFNVLNIDREEVLEHSIQFHIVDFKQTFDTGE